MKKLNTKTGFTLAELLIVVAIIAILVAIGIPAFSTAMERSRETVDLANIRGAYAEYMAGTLGGVADTGYYKITLKQRDCKDWIIDVKGFLSNIVDSSGNDLAKMPADDGTDTNAFQPGILWVKFTSVSGSDKPTLSYVEDDVTTSGSGKNAVTTSQPKGMPKAIYSDKAPSTAGVVQPITETTDAKGKTTTNVNFDSDWFLTREVVKNP